MQIRAASTSTEGLDLIRVQVQCLDNVFAHRWRGGRSEADYWDGRVVLAEMGEMAVGGAEVVAPFGDTVGFIDGDTR